MKSSLNSAELHAITHELASSEVLGQFDISEKSVTWEFEIRILHFLVAYSVPSSFIWILGAVKSGIYWYVNVLVGTAATSTANLTELTTNNKII